jgi:hypothetical protein
VSSQASSSFYLLNTESSHWYFIKNEDFPNGVEMPSATNILNLFPNPNLDYWKENTSPEEIKQKQEDGKMSGSKVHHCCFLLAVGEEINPNIGLTKNQIRKLPLETSEDKAKDDELLFYLSLPLNKREFRGIEGFANFWEEYKPISIGKEMKVYHKHLRYAGTLDWVGYLWNKKTKKYELWVIDYKISNSHQRSYESQGVAYLKALNSMYKKPIRARVGILYLGKTTKKRFQLKEVTETKRAWDDFILVKKLWHSINPNISAPLIELKDNVSVDVSYKRKGRIIKL